MNPDKAPYIKTDGTTLSYLKVIVQWQNHQSEDWQDHRLEYFLAGALNDMPATYYIHDLNVIIQAPHKVASSSLKKFVQMIETTYNLITTRYESFDDYLRFVNLHNPLIYRLVREPVCRILSNINFQSRSLHKLYGVTLDIENFDACTGTDPHAAPQSSSMLAYIDQHIYDNMIKLRAKRIRSYINNILSDDDIRSQHPDTKYLTTIVDVEDKSLLQYYLRFKKIDTTKGSDYNDLYWAHLNDIVLYENIKYLWVTEDNSNTFDFLSKELGLTKMASASGIVMNKTPNIKIGNRMPYKVQTLDTEVRQRLYQDYKLEVDFLRGSDYINTDPVFFDQ